MRGLAFDGLSRANHTTHRRPPEKLAAPSDAGSGGQLPVGDTTVPETPGMPHLLRRLRPRLEHTLRKQLLDATPIENPAQAFVSGPTT
ncbi:hypothetical protein [Streptomyces sp. NBC_01727]|uniref:hypothetical protein n=1 Tax=Streptomyces sp. NBC_01727 TaxID=2975924 RepID=UPI002E140D9E|nr:hypothetical protein OIE76_04750 [Streptomyces sp. NBC_01727]